MLKKMAVIGLTAGALLLAAPTAANASSNEVPDPAPSPHSYAETPRVSVGDPIIDPCEVSTISFGAGYFLPGETVLVSVSGLKGDQAQISGNVAGSDGSLVVSFRPPADGSGSYALTFSAPSGNVYTATITVADAGTSCDDDPTPAPAGTELPLTGSNEAGGSTGSGFELALTGGSLSPWILGGGALALTAGGVLVAAGAARRRRA